MSRSDHVFSVSFLTRSCLAMLSTAVLLNNAVAAEYAFEVTPFVGYHAGGQFKDGSSGDTLKVNGSGSAALAINWRAAENGTQYELLYSRQSTDVGANAPVDLKVEYLQLGGTAIVGDADARVVPFAVGGIGATRFSPSAASLSNETRWSFNLGGGVRIPIAQHVRLRFEARGYLTWLEGKSDLFCDGGCAIVAKSKSFFQYEALGGVSVGF